MNNIPTSLRIAIGFIIALWIVGLTALTIGAPGEIVVAAAAIGTVGALVEWNSHRAETLPADMPGASAELQGEPAPQPVPPETR